MGFSETDVASQESGALAPLVSLFFLRENLPNSGDLFCTLKNAASGTPSTAPLPNSCVTLPPSFREKFSQAREIDFSEKGREIKLLQVPVFPSFPAPTRRKGGWSGTWNF